MEVGSSNAQEANRVHKIARFSKSNPRLRFISSRAIYLLDLIHLWLLG